MKRASTLLVLTCALIAALASPAYARRAVPVGFFGVVAPPLMVGQPPAVLDQQMALMARSGVESVRMGIAWAQIEPSRGVFDFSAADSMVEAADRHGLRVDFNVAYTPGWASAHPRASDALLYPPARVSDFVGVMRRLVQRYGPGGSLWRAVPNLPRDPVHEWQLWNEQDAPWYWKDPTWWKSYTKLLKAAYPVIHHLDHGASVVAGSLVASSYRESPWVALSQMYRAGAKRYFDAVSVHPFTDTASSVSLSMNHLVTIVQRMRSVMRGAGDARKPLIITEMQWSAAAGKVPQAALLGFETTPHGQAVRLSAAYRILAKRRAALGVTQVYWSTWATQYDAVGDLSDMIFRFTGLTRFTGGGFQTTPLLGAYATTAAQLEGCRKGVSARCA